ncbi:alkaline phosphatase family protein [Rhabdaerophilum calidifontis]|uniref:alkaline phosphatase family protein n=1 Tax=Rhabdaerophilum calidifontis TaxID=2604328 RepID=UPI00123B1B0B|nr:alkaline phosphatase family protein [Rhabdaerophilum calidifontis]
MSAHGRAPAERVVVIVLDGLRPDHVRPDLTPNILRLAARGARYRQAHSVFPSMTRVATSSIASGANPRTHGVVGNAFWHFEAFPDRAADTSKYADLARIAALDPRGVLTAETFADRLAQAGRRMAVVHSGSSGSAFLINPRVRENGHWTFSIHGGDHTLTPEANAAMEAKFGPRPAPELPRFAQMTYGTTVFVEHVLAEMKPDLALIWLPEPDTSYHYRKIGSADALAALRHADLCVGRILDHLEAGNALARTAVILLSDHGQITVNEAVPLFETLRAGGFDAATRGAEVSIVGTSGASGEIRLRRPDPALRDRIAAFLAEQPDMGLLFSRGREGGGVEGEAPHTLAFDLLQFGHNRAPDLAFVLRSDAGPDPDGLPGLGRYMGGDVPLMGGMHGGLNRHELATVLVLTGAGIAPVGLLDQPAGLPDIAPTLLALLGIEPAPGMTGRVLAEAFERTPEAGQQAEFGTEESRTEIFETALGSHVQRLERRVLDGRAYLVSGTRIER